MASVFRIQVGDTDGEVYELSVTTNVTVTEESINTKHKVESREVITDNSVVMNREITYNGLITSIRRSDQGAGANNFGISAIQRLFDNPTDSNFKDPKTYLEGLAQVRRDSEFVTCFLANELTPISNCLIDRFTYVKDQEGGLTTWRVSIKLSETRLTTRAVETSIPAPSASDVTGSTTDAGNATTEALNTGALNTTALLGGANSVYSPVGG